MFEIDVGGTQPLRSQKGGEGLHLQRWRHDSAQSSGNEPRASKGFEEFSSQLSGLRRKDDDVQSQRVCA